MNNSQIDSKLRISGINLIYLLAMILLITAGTYFQKKSFNTGILITEFILVALPVFVYVIFKKGSIKKELRFNKLHFMDAFLVFLIFIFGFPVALFVNLIGNIFLSLFGKLIQSPIPMAQSINEYFVLILIVAGSAGICEELLFRGLFMRGYEGLGKWPSIIFTAVLFSMLHLNIQNIFGPLFLGIVLGYVVFTTNSIFAGMLGHFTNNALSVTISFLLMQLPFVKNAVPASELSQGVMLQGLIIWTFIIGIVASISGLMMFFCIRSLKELSIERQEQEKNILQESKKRISLDILKNAKISWPLYVSSIIFVFYSILEIVYIITGQSLLKIIF